MLPDQGIELTEESGLALADALEDVAEVVVGIVLAFAFLVDARCLVGELTPLIAYLGDAHGEVVELGDAGPLGGLLEEGAIDEAEAGAARAYLLEHTDHLRQVEHGLALAHGLLPGADALGEVGDATGADEGDEAGL